MLLLEFIEPYIKDFLMSQLEDLAYEHIDISEFRTNIKGIYEFVQFSCGLHAKIASDNILLYNTLERSDENLIETAKKIYLEKDGGIRTS
jgi:hypothetical protein